MKPAVAVDRFAALAVRQHLSLGVLRTANAGDFALVLAAAVQAFAPDRAYTEREVNDLLRAWLAHAGSMLAVDHVEFRRWLVDCRVLDRDGFGHAYRVGAPDPEIRAFAAELAGADLAMVARAARERAAAARDERKRQWQQKLGAGDA